MRTDGSYFDEAKVAEDAARQAGKILISLYDRNYHIEEKSKGHPVTTADLMANRKIREILLGSFPQDGWLSEEDKDDSKRLSQSRVWVVDPLDGTKEFIDKNPQFTVSIGLVVEGRPVLGVVYNPVEEALYRAVKGEGAMLNDRGICVTPKYDLKSILLLVSRSEPRKKFQPFQELCQIEPVGSIAYRLAKVAAGEGDGTLTFRSVRDWDICAGVAIVEAAGGVAMNGKGESLLFNQRETYHRGLVASNPVLAGGLREILHAAMAGEG